MPGTENLKIDTLDSASGAKILKLDGPLTLQSLFDFQEVVRSENTKPIILDLTGVPYMDSAGLGSVIGSYAGCQRTGRGFAISGISDRVNVLFTMTQVNGLLPCFDSLEAAEKSLEKPTGKPAVA